MIRKFCLDTGTTQSVTNMNYFNAKIISEVTLHINTCFKIADVMTLNLAIKAVKIKEEMLRKVFTKYCIRLKG